MLAYEHSAIFPKLQESSHNPPPPAQRQQGGTPLAMKKNLVHACYNHPQVADLLQYFLIAAQLEVKRSAHASTEQEKGCSEKASTFEDQFGSDGNVVVLPATVQPFAPQTVSQNVVALQHSAATERPSEATSRMVAVKRTHQQILRKLPHPPSRKTLIKYLDLLNEWGYVINRRYQRVFWVNLPRIQQALEQPPEPSQPPQKVVTLQHSERATTLPKNSRSASHAQCNDCAEAQGKVVTLQQKVVELQQKVVELQHFYEERIALLSERVERLEHALQSASSSSIIINNNSNRNRNNKEISFPIGKEETRQNFSPETTTFSAPRQNTSSETDMLSSKKMPPAARAQPVAGTEAGDKVEETNEPEAAAAKQSQLPVISEFALRAAASARRELEARTAQPEPVPVQKSASVDCSPSCPEPSRCTSADSEERQQALAAYREACRLYWKGLPRDQRPVPSWGEFWRIQQAKWERLNPRPKPSQRDMELRRLLQQKIDEWRGFPLQDPGQIIKERKAIQSLAQGLLRYEQGDHEQGYTLEELEFVWRQATTRDEFWSQPRLKQTAGAVAIAQCLPLYLPSYRATGEAIPAWETETELHDPPHRKLTKYEREQSAMLRDFFARFKREQEQREKRQ